MKQTTTKEKRALGRSLTDNRAVMLVKDLIRPVLNLIAGFRVPYQVIVEQPCQPLPGKPVIYAANHFCFADTPIMGRVVPKRSYILLGRQRLGFSDWLYFFLNGAIFVDRMDREDTAASKLAMEAYLKKGRSIVMFPEGTWNLTENQLTLPMKWGIVGIAGETGAQVIPTMLEYDRERKKCFVRFGAPMLFTPESSKADSIAALRDALAAMRWECWERNGVFCRRDLDMTAERKKLFYSVEEFPPIDWAYESACIYHPHTEPANAYAHLSKLIPRRENAFLFSKKGKTA